MATPATAAELVHDVQRRIGDAQTKIAALKAQRADLVLAVGRDDADAVAQSLHLRELLLAAEAELEALTESLEPLRGFARLEEDAADVAAARRHRQQAAFAADAHIAAAERVDELVLQLGIAMRVADHAARLAHGAASQHIGQAASAITTQPCADHVIGLLVLYGAIPREHLPGIFLGELPHIRPLVEAARKHAAQLARVAPIELEGAKQPPVLPTPPQGDGARLRGTPILPRAVRL